MRILLIAVFLPHLLAAETECKEEGLSSDASLMQLKAQAPAEMPFDRGMAGAHNPPKTTKGCACAKTLDFQGAQCLPEPGTAAAGIITVVITCCLLGAFSLYTSSDMDQFTKASEVPKNRSALAFVNFASGFTNLNFCIAIPNAAQGMSEVSGSYTNAGVWVAIYVLGALLLFPFYRSLEVGRTKQALILHAVCAGVGNGVMLVACLTGNVWLIYSGRAIAGMEAGVRFSAQNANSHWTELGQERLDAMFKTQIASASGNACGFVVPIVLELVFLRFLPSAYLEHTFPDEALRREALPLVFMTLYASTFFVAVVTCFEAPAQVHISDTGNGKGPQSSSDDCDASRVGILFSAVTFTGCTRSFIGVAFKAGAMIMLTCDFVIPSVAGLLIFISEIQVVMCRSVVSVLAKYLGERAKLQRCLELLGLLSMPFLYNVFGHGRLGISVFLCGSAIFFNANQSQAGLMHAIGSEAAIAHHPWLSKQALSS
mmetsp:Transcript_32705/g.71337  ORF Transcript_32705/g.71337 Transcript_32705/m.71337 type:complete len:485 (+) Transcript_32705:76-1530(+)